MLSGKDSPCPLQAFFLNYMRPWIFPFIPLFYFQTGEWGWVFGPLRRLLASPRPPEEILCFKKRLKVLGSRGREKNCEVGVHLKKKGPPYNDVEVMSVISGTQKRRQAFSRFLEFFDDPFVGTPPWASSFPGKHSGKGRRLSRRWFFLRRGSLFFPPPATGARKRALIYAIGLR